MTNPLMKCGHTGFGRDAKTGEPVCIACLGIRDGATEIDDNPPDLSERMAQCSCGKAAPSSPQLAFFKHEPTRKTDSYYCGCWGWN